LREGVATIIVNGQAVGTFGEIDPNIFDSAQIDLSL